jgi:hypothetical protein
MVQDLIDRKMLIGKVPSEVQELLGTPDFQKQNGYDYRVVTISRCYVWECTLGVAFDTDSNRVTFVAVSD